MKKINMGGFTLIEITLVLVLIGILGAVAISKFYDLDAKAQRDAACAFANQYCSDVNGRIAQLLFEGKSCVDAQSQAMQEMSQKYFSDGTIAKRNPNGMSIAPFNEAGKKNPTTITVILKDYTMEEVPSSMVACDKLKMNVPSFP